MEYLELFDCYKQQNLSGRYITNDHIEPILNGLSDEFKVLKIGKSVLDKPIYSVEIGFGKTKILMWSQMHGNESTTTKAVFDVFNLLNSDSEFANSIKSSFTILCIPILNPDGAKFYTRENALNIDLNRDAKDLTQPESLLLRSVFDNFKPDYCYNLHDQRSIYGVGDSNLPATVSFLAPAFNIDRDVNLNRQKAINIIANMNTELQKYIPGQIGRFDDTFNENCVGDTFQSLGVPTILFEAGHFKDDYEREITRIYIFVGILTSFVSINENDIVLNKNNKYLSIPQNKVSFYDFVYRKIKINSNSLNIITTFAAHYNEILVDDKIVFEAKFIEIGNLDDKYGHFEYIGKGEEYSDEFGSFPKIDSNANFILNKCKFFVNGLIKI